MFVEDNHALNEHSTMDLTAKMLAGFFDLVAEERKLGAEGIASKNEAGASWRNVEVKQS